MRKLVAIILNQYFTNCIVGHNLENNFTVAHDDIYLNLAKPLGTPYCKDNYYGKLINK